MEGSSVGSSQSCGIVTTQRMRCAKVPFIAFWSLINKLLTLSQRRTLCHQLASYTVMMSRPCRAVRGPKVSQPRVHLHPMSRVWHRCKALQDCAVCSPPRSVPLTHFPPCALKTSFLCNPFMFSPDMFYNSIHE